jgi:hypothetical protein
MMSTEGSPFAVPTLPVHETFLPDRRPPVDLQDCSRSVVVPDLHPDSEIMQHATTNARITGRPKAV